MSNVQPIFAPKGEKPQWEYLFDVLRLKQVNEVATYEELSEAVGFNVRQNRSPLYLAQKQLEKQHLRTIVVEKGVGYRIAEATEHEELARNHQKRGRRQIKRAIDKIVYVDRGRLTPEAVKRFDAIQMTLARQEDLIKRNDVRLTNVEKAIQATRQATAKTAEELEAKQAKMIEALKRHGINIDAEGDEVAESPTAEPSTDQ